MFPLSTLLVILAFCGGSLAIKQTSAQTPAAMTNIQAKPQTTPAPEIKDPEVKAFVERFNSVVRLFNQDTPLMSSADPESRTAAHAKLVEVLQLSRSLYDKLNDEKLGENVAQTGTTKANYQTVLKSAEVGALIGLGNLSEVTRDWKESVNYKKRALAAIRELLSKSELTSSPAFKNLAGTSRMMEVSTLGALASTLSSNLNQPQEALDYANEALFISRRLQQTDEDSVKAGKAMEGGILQRVALIYHQMDDRTKAVEYLKQAVLVYQSLSDQGQVASLLSQIGNEYLSALEYDNALKSLEEALEIAEAAGDKAGQARIIGLTGVIYDTLGNEPKLRELLNRELAILQSPDYDESPKKDTNANASLGALAREDREFFRLMGVAYTYRRLKQYDQSLSYYEKALPVARSFKKPDSLHLVLSSIAAVHTDKEDWQKALSFHQQALIISRGLAQRSIVASDLLAVSRAFLELGKSQEAIENAREALLIYQSLGADRENIDAGYASSLNLIARAHGELGNRRLAIFFEKQAVNGIQRERGKLKNLDPEGQRGYLKRNEKPYRRLANWLIAEGRIPEAEQVLAMLKEEEYFNYLRRDDKVAKEMLDKISLDRLEREAFNRYKEIADRITAIGKEHDELEIEKTHWQTEAKGKGLPPTAAFPRQAQLDMTQSQLDDATTVFVRFLDTLEGKFKNRQTNERDVRLAAVSRTQILLAKLKQPHTVIISTIADEDRLNLIVTTAKVNRAHTVEIKAEELNERVAEFRRAVMNPNVDPRPASKKLYDVLFPPGLLKDLAGVQADTIVWSLDGTLRYVPVSALWDGNRYLTEKYANAVITLAREGLVEPPADRQRWTALGLGVSKAVTIEDVDGTLIPFPSLSAVPAELCAVVNDPLARCSTLPDGKHGVVAGNSFLDEDFTFQTLRERLGNYPIVHIASHFSLNSGDYSSSYLLLGGSSDRERKLTLQMVRVQLRGKFNGVELLTLSACNTGVTSGEDKSNGVEVEGFGALAQELGAKSVLASLWSVADLSTRDLMTEFYRGLKTKRLIGKAAALRNAQLGFLQGKYRAGELPLWRRGVVVVNSADHQAAPFKHDDNAPYGHPYFWSPFVLMGDWK